MTLFTKISNVLTRRWSWPGRLLGFALSFGVLFAAIAGSGVDYPLWVKKVAYSETGPDGVVSDNVVTNMVGGVDFADGINTPASSKIVTYAISYGPGSEADPSKLGGLSFDDSMSAHMHMVGPVQVPTSWSGTANANATVSYTSPLLIPGSSTSVMPATPLTISTSSGGGDGYMPIVYTSADGKAKRFFEIYHHQTSNASINCQNFGDGSACSGYPKQLMDTATNTRLSTSNWVHTVVMGSKIYFPAAVGTSTVGIGCWDASLGADCAYIPLDTKVAGGWDDKNASWSGVMQLPGQPSQLYLTQAGTVYCWDVARGAACSPKTQVMTPSGHFDATSDQGHTDMLVAGSKNKPNTRLFVLINGWLTCADVSSWPATACGRSPSRWPIQIAGTNSFNILSQYLDASGNVIGACVSVQNAAPPCFDTVGRPLTTPAVLNSVNSGYYIGSATTYGTRVYYAVPFYPNSFGSGQTVCWDFATNAACAGFTDGGQGATDGVRRWTQPNKGSTSQGAVGGTDDYGYQFDGQCGYGLGDTGKLWSFDPKTGAAPCVVTSSDITVPDPKAFCDGKDHLSNWDKIQLKSTPPEVQSVEVKVYDAAACPAPNDTTNCTLLAKGDSTAQLMPDRKLWEIPFVPVASNGRSLKRHPSIRVSITYSFANGQAPTSYKDFSATTLYTPDATIGDTRGAIGQVCMRAQVGYCPASVLDNQAIISKVGSDGSTTVLGRALSTIYTNMADLPYSDTAPAVNNSKSLAGRVLYRTTYQVTDWSGDLTAYKTDSEGNPGDALWTTSAAGGSTAAGAARKLPPASRRNILTTTGTGMTKGIKFDVASLPATALSTYFGSAASDQNDLINYLRGDRSLEAAVGTSHPFRRRMLWDKTGTVTALGDFIHSAPVYDNKMVYAQANDGMLHAFNATSGVESFAFVPSAVFPLLKPLSAVSYQHNWIMDGQVAIAHAGTGTSATATLIGSTGGMKPALFGIDVSGLPATAPGPSQVLFETTHAALGRANGAIQIATLGGQTVALLGNGMGSTGDQAQLIQVNIADGSITAITTGAGSASAPNGLSAPTPLVVGGQLVAVYAGDALGNLWRFPVSSSSIGAPTKLFTTDTAQPISAAPTVSGKLKLKGKTGYYVYFGTGKSVDRTDIAYDPGTADEQAVQALYGVFDAADSAGAPSSSSTISRGSLVQQTIGADNKVSDYPVDLSSMNGWYLNLASGDPGSKLAAERILSPVIYNASADSVTLVTAIPQKSGCYNASLAGSHFINIRATTGGTPPKSSIVGPPGTGNQVTVMGTLGGLAPTSGPPGVVKYYTSSAVNPTAGSDSGSGKGKIDDKDVMTKDSILKRTSWVQLY